MKESLHAKCMACCFNFTVFFYGGKGNLVKQVRTQRPTDNIQCIFKKKA